MRYRSGFPEDKESLAQRTRDLRKIKKTVADIVKSMAKKYDKADLHSLMVHEVSEQIKAAVAVKLSKKDQADKDRRTAESKAALLGAINPFCF